MLNNLLQTTCCWGIFYLLYWVFFRKETFFRLNRFYLLTTLILGIFLPYLQLDFFAQNDSFSSIQYLQTVTVGVENWATEIVITPNQTASNSSWNWQQLCLLIYGIGITIMGAKFLLGLWKIFQLFQHANKKQLSGYQLVTHKNIRLPFSFFYLLFWNQELNINNPDHQKILQHELAHIRQKHSVDVVILEIICILFWWNPLVWIYKKSLRTVHEYLADDAVLQTTQKKQYGQLLIRQSHSGMQVALANNFIQSQLKNRIMMMMKSKSQSQQLWKYLLIIPVFGMLFLTFSCENVNAQSKQEKTQTTDGEVFKVVEEMPRFVGTDVTNLETETEKQDASNRLLLNYIYENVKYPESAEKAGTEGVTVVRFVVDKTGKLRDFETVRSVSKDIDAEALRVTQSMPDWIPGKQKGKAVAVQFNLPIKFKLSDDDAEKSTKNATDFNKENVEMPYFPGCEDVALAEKRGCADTKMLEFIFANINYPKEAKAANAEGVVAVKFTVAQDGSLKNPKVVKSVHPKCDEEVLRIVHEMPNWIPARKDGNVVAVEFTLPVKFKLDGENTNKKSSQNIDNQLGDLDIREFKAFPNPASDMLEISFTTTEDFLDMKITDSTGKWITIENFINNKDGELSFKTDKIDLSQAARGMATITFKNKKGDKVKTEKVILQ